MCKPIPLSVLTGPVIDASIAFDSIHESFLFLRSSKFVSDIFFDLYQLYIGDLNAK